MIYKKYDMLEQRIDDLEITILSVMFHYPELMKKTMLKDEHFIKYKKLWYFMKTFYQRFGTFDLPLMFSCVGNKEHLMEMITEMLDIEFTSANFKMYEKRLIEIREQKENDRRLKDLIFYYANQLITDNITIDDFKDKINGLLK